MSDIYEALKMEKPQDGSLMGDWYSYLINNYIPNNHPEDMGVFIELGFDPHKYLIYRLLKEKIPWKDREFGEITKELFEKQYPQININHPTTEKGE